MKLIFAAGLLATALLAINVTPTQCSPVPEAEAEPEPTALAEADSSKGNSKGGGGDLLDLEVLLAVDLSGLSDILNKLLSLLLDVSQASKCEYNDYATKIQVLLVQLDVYINLLGIKVQVNLRILLGPLLQAVQELVAGLLRGVLDAVLPIVNILLGVLATLNLKIDLDVAVRLGNLLGVNVKALIDLKLS